MRDVSGFVVRGSDQVSTRKPPWLDRVSNYRDTAMRNMSVRQDGIDKAFVVTSGSSRRLTDILSPPSPAVNISLSLSRGPRLTRRLIDAIRFLRVITVALEPNRFNLPAAI